MAHYAIIGSGIAGVSAARALALNNTDGPKTITLYEIGRGPGGRASTRKTRAIPELRINHGAPYADISTEPGQALLRRLGAATQPYHGERLIIDGRTGETQARVQAASERLITGADGEMANIAGAMLEDAHSGLLPGITTAYSSMVRGITRAEGGDAPWILSDKDGEALGRADWLVVAGSGIAHPRWSATFGGEPPLVAAAAALNDPRLDQALTTIAQQSAAPVL
ncbi:MAG: FAD-dependent oxidoreductase, partial [Spiribacter sp.]|nr:FAD-dependent oxidoreductase [Spiribacter sp.]